MDRSIIGIKNIRVKDRQEFCNEVKELLRYEDRNYKKTEAINSLEKVIVRWSEKYPSLKRVKRREDLLLLFTYLDCDY